MVSAMENRARVVCRPVGPAHEGPGEEWLEQPVVLDAAEPLEGCADLLTPAVGRRLSALVPRALSALVSGEASWEGEAELVRPGVIRLRA
jgi:hypothetical protein